MWKIDSQASTRFKSETLRTEQQHVKIEYITIKATQNDENWTKSAQITRMNPSKLILSTIPAKIMDRSDVASTWSSTNQMQERVL